MRAKLCRRAWQYPWSSAALHTDEKAESELLNLPRWYRRITAAAWTHTGRPLGSDRFMSKLETLLGRRVRPLPVGRPKKKADRQDSKGARDR
ncbi:MAG: hypothetical protein M1376_07700 [Planctomycetes bacterium]|nr:hypothetical protein [Planctomycetota bacterium]